MGRSPIAVRVHPRRRKIDEELSRRLSRLDRLPLRPLTARSVMNALPEDANGEELDAIDSSKTRSVCEVDPGWIQAQSTVGLDVGPLAIIAGAPWWTVAAQSGPEAEVLGRLWRHSAAVAMAARGFAQDAGDPDPTAVAAAGFLSRLGCWAIAAVEPEWLVHWWRESDPGCRRRREIADLGTDLNDLGRRLAERWGCDPLVVDAAWLHGDHGAGFNDAAFEPARLAYIQEASRWADKTPWSFGHHRVVEAAPSDPRLRILVAEVQVRCSSKFVADDATSHEERMTRQSARLRLCLNASRRAQGSGDRLVKALADSPYRESREEWAARVALTWCAEEGVTAARVVWIDPSGSSLAESTQASQAADDKPSQSAATDQRPPALVIPLKAHGHSRAVVQLWGNLAGSDLERRLASSTIRAAWNSWAALVADCALLERRLQTVVRSHRVAVETEEIRLRHRQLDALSEFAGGAGHELNNPLAVIVGRAQLLLARTQDPETIRSLHIILNQAGRAHRILRDLMFVARPPTPQRRACLPSELLGACLRDFQAECAERGVRLVSEVDDSLPATWADPEALRHLAEILLRNAIQATPAGGRILVRAMVQGDELLWSFSDTGKGIGDEEAAHLFDPFYCGRQAGRGLGLGLPRAARIVELVGGQLRWTSNPAHGTVFQVHLPLTAPPGPCPSAGPRPSPGAPLADHDRISRQPAIPEGVRSLKS
jgi:signal transduction histidine kinase